MLISWITLSGLRVWLVYKSKGDFLGWIFGHKRSTCIWVKPVLEAFKLLYLERKLHQPKLVFMRVLYPGRIGIRNVTWSFCGERKSREPGEKPSEQTREPMCNNKLNPHLTTGRNWTQATLVGGELYHHCAIPVHFVWLNPCTMAGTVACTRNLSWKTPCPGMRSG